jgi:hypothetical protein
MAQTRPLKLRIMDALTAILQEITIANGYKHDLGESVFRGRAIFGQNDPIPMVSILDVPIPLEPVVTPEGGSESKGGWEIVLQGFVKDDKVNPTDPGHFLMADVKQRLALEKKKEADFELFELDTPETIGMGQHVVKLEMSSGIVRPPDEVSAKAYFWLTLTLTIVEDIADPYED